MPQIHHVAATVHGRFLVEAPAGDLGDKVLLVGCHGYGENAEEHLAGLAGIPGGQGRVLCAVQALHPFYRTRTGDVVASWMTSLDRELAIADNVRYLGAVVTALRQEVGATGPLVYAGFSQGVAMAWRAAALAGHAAAGVIALAGDLPPELEGETLARLPRPLIGRGRDETWYTEAKLQGDVERLRHAGVEAEVCTFAGGHEWTAEFQRACGEYLEGL